MIFNYRGHCIPIRHWSLSTFAACVFLALPATLPAETLLRWKLKSGDALQVETHQETQSRVEFSGKSATTKIDLTLTVGWKVTAAEAEQFTIQQTIEHIAARLTPQPGAAIEFDSAATKRATGQARQLADSLQPLVGAEFQTVMNVRGEVVSVKPLNAAAEALAAGSGDKADASRSSIEQVLRQPLIVLPADKVKVGETWTTTNEATTNAGKAKTETTYKLAKAADDSEPCEIEFSTKLLLSAPAKTTIKTQEHTGRIAFSVAAGHVLEASHNQKLETTQPYRETTITVTLTSHQTTTIKPQP